MIIRTIEAMYVAEIRPVHAVERASVKSVPSSDKIPANTPTAVVPPTLSISDMIQSLVASLFLRSASASGATPL